MTRPRWTKAGTLYLGKLGLLRDWHTIDDRGQTEYWCELFIDERTRSRLSETAARRAAERWVRSACKQALKRLESK